MYEFFRQLIRGRNILDIWVGKYYHLHHHCAIHPSSSNVIYIFAYFIQPSDPVTGIPTLGTTQYSGQIATQNFNKLVHSRLFPNSVIARSPSGRFPLVSRSMDRLLRYERSLSNQYRKELDMDVSSDEGE